MQPAAKPVPVQQIGPHMHGLRTDEEFNEFMTNNKAKPVSFKAVLSVVWVQRFPQVASPPPWHAVGCSVAGLGAVWFDMVSICPACKRGVMQRTR